MAPPADVPVAPVVPERIRGVPIPLPVGEHVRWQGAPDARALARWTFHQRKIAVYVAAMLAWWVLATAGDVSVRELVARGAVLLVFALVPIIVAEVLARVVARTTVYAITDRRMVLKIGMVFPMTINVPHRLIASAGVRQHADGTGQIAVTLVEGERLAYGALWPHCRPFLLNWPVPVLRGLTAPVEVGSLLREAVLAQEGPSLARETRSEPAGAPTHAVA
ncbi:MAG: PH domain-containing protein [Gemmatimonadaceae bacterium]|nr:PH domain-containing protein [Gemmatimonadaceae bacterium]